MTYKFNCQCPYKSITPKHKEGEYSKEERIGMNHKPNKCKCRNELSVWKRGKKEIILCSCCFLFGDINIRELTEKELRMKA